MVEERKAFDPVVSALCGLGVLVALRGYTV